MTIRCGCSEEADDIMFGPMHRCSVDPKPPADLPRFIPSWMFVAPERPYETTLGEDETHD